MTSATPNRAHGVIGNPGLELDWLRRAGQGQPADEELALVKRELVRLRVALEASKARESRAWELARRDPLTGLPNRAAFETHSTRVLSTHTEASQVFGLLFIDLDRFKQVNDRLGHPAGDELLRIVAARLMHAVRRGDLVSRHGGDEFLCLLPELSDDERALAIAHALVRAVQAPCRIGSQQVSVRPSIGIALYPRHGLTIGALVSSADRAMYRAKAQHIGVAMAG